jgi:glycosyltransferase involved in cell wall biosynthesis
MRTDGTFVILTPGFAASEKDTTCLPLQQSFVRTLNEVYPHLKVIILSFQYPFEEKKYEWFKATVYSFNGKNRGGLSGLFLRGKINKTLTAIHHSEKIIGVLSFWYGECAFVGKKFSARHGVRHRCWLLGQDARAFNKHPKRVALHSEEMVALSDFVQDEFERNHKTRPAVVIPPAINTNHLSEFTIIKDIDIVAAGSLIVLKQYDLLVNIIAEIKKIVPGVKAILVGEGPERQKIQKLIVKHSLEKNIDLVGELPHADVIKMMQRTKVFLHPSSYEGFGVVCLEALYSGAHVISFVQPMKKGIANWKVVKTSEEMVQKTIEVLRNAFSNYKSVVPFSMQETVEQMMELFHSE